MIRSCVKWVTCDKDISAPIIYKTVVVNAIKKAEISICGLGFYELFINGKRVGKEYFKPVFSDYCKRDFTTWLYPTCDETSHTIYYDVWDITEYLVDGNNTVAVLLGNGYYRQNRRNVEGNVAFSEELILAYDITLQNKNGKTHICTDGTETYTESFIKENNLFFGETQDFSHCVFPLFQCSNSGKRVKIAKKPDAVIFKNNCPLDKIVRTIQPKLLFERDNKKIYDAGENITGNVSFTAISSYVKIIHSENINGNELDTNSCGINQTYVCEYKSLKKGQKVSPFFTWGGFRYFEIEGETENISVEVIHSAVNQKAFFNCGNDVINWIYNAYVRTQLNNMHCGVPMDCPHRERLGYTGDGQLTSESAMLVFDSEKFYEKWFRDIVDCQDKQNGHVQHTAPFCGGGGGPGGWGGAIVIVLYRICKFFADKKLVKKYLPNVIKYLDCMQGFCENGLVVKERKGGWCLGDWCTPDKVALPEPFVNTFFYILCMQYAMELGDFIGEKLDYSDRINYCKKALEQAYYNKNSNSYCNGVQGANVFALTLGLGNVEMEKSTIEYYERRKTLDTGIFGTDILFGYLVKKGYLQLAFDLLSTCEYPSYGYMKNNGATTLWENWNGKESHNHPMFGSVVKYLFYGFLGLRVENYGKKVYVVPPSYINGLDFVECKIKVFNGKIVYIRHEFKNGTVISKVRNASILHR